VAVDGPPAPSDPHSNTLLRTMPSKTISQRSLSALNLEWDCGLDLSYFLLPRCGKFSGACRDPLFGDRSCTRFRLTRNRSGARMPDSSVCIAYFHFGEHHLCSSLLCAFRAIADQPNGLSQGASRGPLSVPAANTVGGNGVYSYGRTFPQSTSQRDNDFVDVLFTPIAQLNYLSLSFSPPNPRIAADAAQGCVVTTVTAAWSDGTAFAGSLSFAPPKSNDQGAFTISGDKVIINPSGPCLTGLANTTQNITVQAGSGVNGLE
jgi:hypothetical protein